MAQHRTPYSPDSTIVVLAVAALRNFIGRDADRRDAIRALRIWQHAGELSDAHTRQILDYFTAEPIPHPGKHYLAEPTPAEATR